VTCPIEGVIAELIVEPIPVIPDPDPSNASGWALLALVLGILIYEVWAIATGRPTISQWVQRATRGRPWWKAFGVVSIGLLLWHLFEGGPL
jgi:succinate dehydrogenase hydrophobic anchor subunit